MSKKPSKLDLLIKVLTFLAADGPAQVAEIRSYIEDYVRDPSMRAHISDDPIYETAELALKISGDWIAGSFSNSEGICEILHEIRWVVSASNFHHNETITEEYILANPEWRILRRLARECLGLIGQNDAEVISIFTLLCFLGD